MHERQAMLGHRVEIRQQHLRISANCEALRDKLRTLTPPTADADDLDRDAILNTAATLHSELGTLEAVRRKLAILNRELGE